MNSTDDEITLSMRRYHQQRRAYILAQLEKAEDEKEEKEKNRREIEELVILSAQTAQMLAGRPDSLPISIPFR